MLSKIPKQLRYITGLCSGFLLISVQPLWAAGPPAPSLFSNAVALCLVVLMILLLVCIGFLGNILLYTAGITLQNEKKKDATAKMAASAVVLLIFLSGSIYAQNGNTGGGNPPTAVDSTIAGMSAFAFYMMISVVFLEILIILVLLFNIRLLLKPEAKALIIKPKVAKKPSINWWIRLNRFKPVEQEADIDLGHDYDGIRELDNRLPPWWIYGFYLTILFSGIYLWRFQVSHTGPSAKQEYDISVAQADNDIKAYLAKKGDAVDENTVTILSAPDDLTAGKTIFLTTCVTCHKASGGGDVGPNLTDDYWVNGGNIKSIFKTIRYGINAMPQWQNAYSNKQIAQVASYVKSLTGTNPPNAKAAQGVLFKDEPVPVKADSSIKENSQSIKASLNR